MDSSNYLFIENPYILDGMGHTITVKELKEPYNFSNIRDVYITDGSKTIYIDPEGNIVTVNND